MIKRLFKLFVLLGICSMYQVQALSPWAIKGIKVAGAVTGAIIGGFVTPTMIMHGFDRIAKPGDERLTLPFEYMVSVAAGVPVGALGGGMLGFKASKVLLNKYAAQQIVKSVVQKKYRKR